MLKTKKWSIEKVVLISLLCVFLASIFAAVMYHLLSIDEKYRRIKYSSDTEEQVWSDWYYNGIKYSVAPGLALCVTTSYEDCTEENGFSLISWGWYLPFYRVKTFAVNVEDPRYIYCPYQGSLNRVRVSENFDYMDEEYIICDQEYFGYERIRIDTEFSFKLKDVYYIDECIERENNDKTVASFCSRSISFERLEFYGAIFFKDGEYYIDFNNDGTSRVSYKVKPEFIELLKKADILNSDS